MKGRCPFCLDRSASRVGSGPRPSKRVDAESRLMTCEDCERWYWADSGQEVVRLCEICTTPLTEPRKCFEDVRELLGSGGSAFPRQRTAEFNRICSLCPNASFAPGPLGAQA
ncbi:MAG: hypothetical protein ABFD52_06005 [Acidobacteriota bacterium]